MNRKARIVKAAALFLAAVLMATGAFTYGVVSAHRQTRPSKWVLRLMRNYRAALRIESPERTGSWYRAPDQGQGQDSGSADAQSKLAALPYLQGYSAAPEGRGVTIYDQKAAYDGATFLVSGDSPRAQLIDMKGNVVHEWSKTFDTVWRKRDQSGLDPVYKTYWRRAKPLPNGDLLAIFMDFGLIKLDRDSKVLWTYEGRCHHDVEVTPRGEIYVLTRELKRRGNLGIDSWVVEGGVEGAILEDFITVLSPEGKELKKVSLLDSLLNSEYAPLLENAKYHDLFHANSIEFIQSDRGPFFAKGRVLVSFRNIHALAVVDVEQAKVTWAATGLWKYQHEPQLLENGHVLLFDNRGNRGKSQAIEFDPVTQKIAWSYRAEPADAFYSREAGTIQRLQNGNTLINESERGRLFEVTPAGEVVWEFLNPYRAGDQNELIAATYDGIRLDAQQVGWLQDGGTSAQRVGSAGAPPR